MGRVITCLALSVLVMGTSFALRLAWESQRAAQAQETGTCPSAQLIDTFEGNGDQQTDTFDTTTDSFRVSFETTNTIQGGGGFEGSLFVDVIDANDPNALPVASLSQEGSGQGETFANAPPGSYYLDIIAGGLDYTITVEQCEGGDPSRNPGGSTSASPPAASNPASASASPSPGSSASASPQPRDDGLLEAGGPSHGPVPIMPDGSCPTEFPIKRDGACYE